jgi:peptide/nickel transport system permease protein
MQSLKKKLKRRFSVQESLVTLRIITSSASGIFGLIVVVGFILTAIIVWLTGNLFLPYNPLKISVFHELQPPSLVHFFGTDSLGRDIFSRILAAAPIDAEVALSVVAIAFIIGIVSGTLAGSLGGAVGEVIMRVTDIFLAFPALVLALAIAIALGPGISHSILAIAPVWWPAYTRLARGETLSAKSQDFVEASRALGHKRRYIILHHIIPVILPIMLVYATLDVGNVIIVFSVLSFIGVGAQPPAAEWGLMAFQDQQFLLSAPWVVIIPSLTILFVAIGFSLLGDQLRDALDPKIRSFFS